MEPEVQGVGMDVWRALELALPLIVTVALAWYAVRVESKRSRTDRRVTWRYERTRLAVEAALNQLSETAERTKFVLTFEGEYDSRMRHELTEIASSLGLLSLNEYLPSEVRHKFQDRLEEVEWGARKDDSDELLKMYSKWCRSVHATILGAHHTVANAWVKEGENWLAYVGDSADPSIVARQQKMMESGGAR